MSIDINYNIESNNKEYYNNVTKQYAKFFIDNYYTPTLTSNQLSNWTSITFNENNGYMIGIGDASDTLNHNLIFSSNGGITWSSQLISTNESNNTKWNDITFDGISTYVAVGNANSISNRAYIINFNESLSSINYITNGNNGTQNNNWTSVIYAAGFFTAVSSNGTKRLMTSTNGTNWTGYTITSRSWNRIAYGKGIFIIASTDGNIKLMYSLDNTITWIDCIFTDIYSNPISNISIIFCSKINKFLFSFYYPTDSKSYIYSSTDGITWTKTYEISDTTAIIKSLVWSQSLELIIASCYSSSDFNLIFSRDSINWMLEKTIFTFLSNINSKIIWNRIFSNFIIITDKKSSGAIITTKNFGINNLLDRKNYYINYNYINSIYYSNNDVKVPSIEYFYIYPILTINNENITYSVSPNLPSGVNLNTYNGVISGGYNQMINFPRTEYTITATDLYEDQKLITKIYLEFISDIYSITTFYYNQNNFLNIFVNLTTSSFYNPTIIGSPKITYQFFSNPNLDIFSVNETTGVLKIKPITSGIYNLTLRATNSKGDFDNSLIVNIINRPPTSFSYNNSQSVTLIVSGSSASYSPSVNDGTELTYSVISNNLNLLPGSSINTNTGVLTIVPSSNPQNVQLNISATNTSGQSTTSFTIIIKNPEIVNFGYTPSSLNDITYNGSKNFNLLSNFIGQNVSYSVSSGFSLPAGLSLNTAIPNIIYFY